MRKILNTVLIFIGFTVVSCGKPEANEKPDWKNKNWKYLDLSNIRSDSMSDTSVQFIEISPMFSTGIKYYVAKGVIIEKTTDTAYVLVKTDYADTRLIIAVPNSNPNIKENEPVELRARLVMGVHVNGKNGWMYTIGK